MTLPRRHFLKFGLGALGALALSVATPFRAFAASLEGAFEHMSLDDAYKAIGGKPSASADIDFQAPEIAENGAVVPVTVKSNIPNTQDIFIMVEKNPAPLVAAFKIVEGTDAFVSTRVKVGQTSNLMAIVRADGKLYSATRETKVTLGGCGG